MPVRVSAGEFQISLALRTHAQPIYARRMSASVILMHDGDDLG
jgi:hypothetical protein